MRIELSVNGAELALDIEPSELLIDLLRDHLGLRGTKRSCEVGVCGACTVLADGDPVSACCTLAADVDGRDVLTIEGLRDRPEFPRLEEAFTRHAALQCGFCTPGMLLASVALLDAGAGRDAAGVRRDLAGNLCRCTGYRSILEAVVELGETWPSR